MIEPRSPRVVLNVNDDDAGRYVTTRVLRRAGWEVREAATGQQALYKAKESPDVVVLDVNLPDMDGYEVCRRLREDPSTAGIKILHLSAHRTQLADRVRGLDKGADAYMTQPVAADELVAMVRSLLRARDAEQAARAQAEDWQSTFDAITDAVALLDEHGVVVRCNKAFATLFKKPFSEVVGRRIESSAKAGEETTIAGQWFRVAEDPVFDAHGAVCGAVRILANITEAKRAHEELRASEQRFRLLVSSVRESAIIMLDPQGKVTSWNEGAERIYGYAPSEIVGGHYAQFFTGDDLRVDTPTTDLQAATLGARGQEEGWRVRKDGARFWAESTTTAVRDDMGALRGFAHVTRDVTERKRLHEELTHRAAALADADRRKDEFLAMLAHELRNPLGVIQTSLHLLETTAAAEDPGAKHRGTIGRQVRHLSRLVDDLLDVSRITRGLIELKKEPIDVVHAMQRIVEQMRPVIDARRHALELVTPDEAVVVHADALRFEQIVVNLISNAVKFMDPGGRLRVACAKEELYATIRVQDEGMGISAAVLPRIFDLFMQADETLARTPGGLGIGLTIVKSLVERHGGNVAAYSDGLGRGAEFVVRLPLVEGAVAPRPKRDERDAQSATRRRRVLVVEDNIDAREALESLLEFWGHDVTTAPDGETGLQKALQLQPDVMLVDIGLPGLDGYEVARKIRTAPGCADVYLVAMTGYGRPEDREAALGAGFNVHLVKPVEADEVSRLLNDLALVRP